MLWTYGGTIRARRFDGDGMIHGLNIKDGKATYATRYVQTSRLLQEECHGASKFVKVGHA